MEADGAEWRFEFIFQQFFAMGVCVFLNATLVPTGHLSFNTGTKFKSPAITRSITAIVPCFSALHVNTGLFAAVSVASAFTAFLFLRLYNAHVRDLVSSTHRRRSFPVALLVSLPWVFLSLLLAGGEREEDICWGVAFVSCMSMASVGAFKLVADYRESSAVAKWVMGQSLAMFSVLCCQRYFLAAGFALLPIFPAIYAMSIPIDNLYIKSLDPARENWRRLIAFASIPATTMPLLLTTIVFRVASEC